MLVFILRNTHTRTRTQTDQAAKKKKRNLAAEQRPVRQVEEREREEKNIMIHALIKTTRTTAFALRRHTQQQKY